MVGTAMSFGALVRSRIVREADKLEERTDEELTQLWRSTRTETGGRNYNGFDFLSNQIPESFYIGAAALTLLSERHGEGYVQRLIGNVKQISS